MSYHELNYTVTAEELRLGDCYTDRKTTGTIRGIEGEVMLLDPVSFGIHCSGAHPILMPCNLPDAYQQTGLKVRFSGVVKEIFANESMTATPFVLESIERAPG
jgi:hypothetical protein